MKKMNKQDIINHLEESGLKMDRWGNFKEITDVQNFRWKLNKTSVRYEVKCAGRWYRIKSGYYSNLSIIDGNLEGLKA